MNTTLLQIAQAASSISAAVVVVWSVIKITRAVLNFIAFCTRMISEHDEMYKDFEHRRELMQRAFEDQNREIGFGASAGD